MIIISIFSDDVFQSLIQFDAMTGAPMGISDDSPVCTDLARPIGVSFLGDEETSSPVDKDEDDDQDAQHWHLVVVLRRGGPLAGHECWKWGCVLVVCNVFAFGCCPCCLWIHQTMKCSHLHDTCGRKTETVCWGEGTIFLQDAPIRAFGGTCRRS